MPVLHWRNPVTGVKENAEVLAFAKPVDLDASGQEVPSAEGNGGNGAFDPSSLAKAREAEKKNALVAACTFGVGKVVYFSFDQTWRLRYGKGDVHHHRLWGQLLRWAAGENLRAGNDQVRLGTDQLTYLPDTPIQVLAKLTDKEMKPLTDATVYAQVLDSSGKKLARTRLTYRTQSHGMYEANIDSTLPPGEYQLALEGDAVTDFASSGVATSLTVAPQRNPIEYGELSVDPETASKMAQLSGGKVVNPVTAADSFAVFGPPSREKTARKETRLWDNWLLLAATIGLLTTEWILRRRGGLA